MEEVIVQKVRELIQLGEKMKKGFAQILEQSEFEEEDYAQINKTLAQMPENIVMLKEEQKIFQQMIRSKEWFDRFYLKVLSIQQLKSPQPVADAAPKGSEQPPAEQKPSEAATELPSGTQAKFEQIMRYLQESEKVSEAWLEINSLNSKGEEMIHYDSRIKSLFNYIAGRNWHQQLSNIMQQLDKISPNLIATFYMKGVQLNIDRSDARFLELESINKRLQDWNRQFEEFFLQDNFHQLLDDTTKHAEVSARVEQLRSQAAELTRVDLKDRLTYLTLVTLQLSWSSKLIHLLGLAGKPPADSQAADSSTFTLSGLQELVGMRSELKISEQSKVAQAAQAELLSAQQIEKEAALTLKRKRGVQSSLSQKYSKT